MQPTPNTLATSHPLPCPQPPAMVCPCAITLAIPFLVSFRFVSFHTHTHTYPTQRICILTFAAQLHTPIAFLALFSCLQDNWQPYLDATKALYRDMVTVTRASSDSPITVASLVYLVHGVYQSSVEGTSSSGGQGKATGSNELFSHDNPHNVCIVSVDPLRRTATILYHAFVPFW